MRAKQTAIKPLDSASPRSEAPKKTSLAADRKVTDRQKTDEHETAETYLTPSRPPAEACLPVVGIGSSAGGLEALEAFLNAIPSECGAALVVISHQSPDHVSLLSELLGKCTSMPVKPATDGTCMQPNHVYVGPPGKHVGIVNSTLHLAPAPIGEMPPLPIDFFFSSLAQDKGDYAICIVLSGTGSDGTCGLMAIKEASGMAMVQDPESAQYAGMPSSAIASGMADFVLPPAAMPAQLIAYIQNLNSQPGLAITDSETLAAIDEPMKTIFSLLRDHTGHDFSAYKPNTVLRRIQRRIMVNQLTTPSQYAGFLRKSPDEIDILFKELLIGVTSFFRDPEAFNALTNTALMPLMAALRGDSPFRVWAPGCANGEEAYTLAIVLHECARKLHKTCAVQIFATDLNAAAIDVARRGQYPTGIAAHIPPMLLKRYFIDEGSHYRVQEELRRSVVFAVQNVIKDPPFTKVNLLCCRNLLIYLNSDLQKMLLPVFHYALKPEGILMLGPSETIGGFGDLFASIDKKWKIFRRKESDAVHMLTLIPSRPTRHGIRPEQRIMPESRIRPEHVAARIETFLLGRFVPPTVVVNERGDIIYIHGQTRRYLEPPSGQPKLNIYAMAREGLQAHLTSAIRQAIACENEIVCRHVRSKAKGGCEDVELSVVKLSEPENMRGLLLITFLPPPPVNAEQATRTGANHIKDSALEQELNFTRESLQSTVEDLQTANEEALSFNEELQSTNEELQSTVEEMETSREEMQSLNEELTTVNAELQSKVDELTRTSDDMLNLLNSTDVATLFLDADLNIKRYTKSLGHLFKIIPTDIGRSVEDIANNLLYDRLAEDARAVLDTLSRHQEEVQAKDGSLYLLRIVPYRTSGNLIEGVVLTFVDITRTRQAETAGRTAMQLMQNIFDTFRTPALVLDNSLHVLKANATFCDTFATNLTTAEGKAIYEVGGGIFNAPKLHEYLEHDLTAQSWLRNVEITISLPTVGDRVFRLNARRLEDGIGLPRMILLGFEDVTTEEGVKPS